MREFFGGMWINQIRHTISSLLQAFYFYLMISGNDRYHLYVVNEMGLEYLNICFRRYVYMYKTSHCWYYKSQEMLR